MTDKIFVSKAPPLGTKEHDSWAKQMMRIQIAQYVDDGATCEQCGYTYKSVDDMLRCNPKRGLNQPDKMTFVCSGCWKQYENLIKEKKD